MLSLKPIRSIIAICLLSVLLIWTDTSPGMSANPGTDLPNAEDAGDTTHAAHENLIKIDFLSRKALRLLLQVEKLNTEFRIASTSDDRWRGWRQFAYTVQNSALTEASLISNMKLRYAFLKKPPVENGMMTQRKPLNPNSVANAAIPSLVGNAVGTAAPIFELGVNAHKYFRDSKRKLTPEPVRKKVHADLKEVDSVLEERLALIRVTKMTEDERQLLLQEGLLLQEIRDLSEYQMKRYYLHAKHFSAFQISAYLIDIVKNSTGVVSGILGICAAKQDRPRLGGTANVFTIVSGAATLAIPVGSRLIARINSEAFERKYFPELKNVGNMAMQEFGMMAEYEHELDKLVTLAKKLESNPSFSGPYNRLYVYVHQNVLFSNQESVALREIRQDLNTTLETYTIAASGGTTKIASGVTGLIGGYSYYDKAIPANKLAAAGSTVYCSGTAAQLLEVIAAKARQEVKQSKLRQNNLLPSQLRKQRLEIIHIMENMLVN